MRLRTLSSICSCVTAMLVVGALRGISPATSSTAAGLRTGDSFSMTWAVEEVVDEDFEFGDVQITYRFAVDYACEVVATDVEGSLLAVTATRMQMSLERPGSSVKWDSADPPDDDARTIRGTEMYSLLIGLPVRVRLDSTGSFAGIERYRELVDAMVRAHGEREPDEPAYMVSVDVQTTWSEAVLANRMARLFPSFDATSNADDPDPSVAIGLLVPCESTRHCEPARDANTFTISGTVVSDDTTRSLGGADMRYDLRGTETGTVTLHETAGLAADVHTAWLVDGHGRMTGLDWPMNVSGKERVQIVSFTRSE